MVVGVSGTGDGPAGAGAPGLWASALAGEVRLARSDVRQFEAPLVGGPRGVYALWAKLICLRFSRQRERG